MKLKIVEEILSEEKEENKIIEDFLNNIPEKICKVDSLGRIIVSKEEWDDLD